MSRLPKQQYTSQTVCSDATSKSHQDRKAKTKMDVIDLLKESQSFIFVTVDKSGCFGRINIDSAVDIKTLSTFMNRFIKDLQGRMDKK